jgi:hypothetical protein
MDQPLLLPAIGELVKLAALVIGLVVGVAFVLAGTRHE